MLCTDFYQKTSINAIILGNAHITKPSCLKQLTYLGDGDYIMCMLYKNCYQPTAHPNNRVRCAAVLLSLSVLVFAILETFILLSVSLLLHTSFRLISLLSFIS